MAQYFNIHPANPQPRLLAQAAALLAQGGVLAVPTDSGYALACHLDDKAAADRLRQVRQLDAQHPLTLLCHDLRELASYARVDNAQFRLLKAGTPGPFTFVLPASRQVPKRVSPPRRKTIGLRVPAHTVLQALLPLRFAALFPEILRIDGKTPCSQVHGKMRGQIVQALKALPLTAEGLRGYNEAIVTRGGVDVKDLNAASMASRKAAGLYFAGEVIDVDAHTGGYNLQIAWSTGALAGRSAARYALGL